MTVSSLLDGRKLLSLVPGVDSGASPVLVGTLAVMVATLVYLILSASMSRPSDSAAGTAQEPPLIPSRIPWFGHLLRLIQHHHGHHRVMLAENGGSAPDIGSLRMLPWSKGALYVVYKPTLVQAALKARSLSFEPYVSTFIARMTSCSARTMEIFDGPEFHPAWLKIIYSTMTGTELLRVNRTALGVELGVLNDTVPTTDGKGGPGTLDVPDLYAWVKNLMSTATTTALFGDGNPWTKEPGLIDAYWTYEASIMQLMMTPLPSVLSFFTGARSAYLARGRMERALTAYLREERDADPSTARFMRDRFQLERKWGIPAAEGASLEVAVVHGSLSNTIPTTFWMLALVFGCEDSEALVERLRKEATAVVELGEGRGSGKRTRIATIQIARLEESCPLLVSCFRETQRIISIGAINRQVLADTILVDPPNATTGFDGRSYLLKKGNHLQISHEIGHLEESHWGPTVEAWEGDRFWEADADEGYVSGGSIADRKAKANGNGTSTAPAPVSTSTTAAGKPSPPSKGHLVPANVPGAYFPFGGGKHICPGRFFAMAEIQGLVLALVLGFEVKGRGGEKLKTPPKKAPVITGGIPRVADGADLGFRLVRREGWEDVEWRVSI